MAKKLIKLNHHVDDYECMWNGIEDLYQEKVEEQIPSFFFFCLSGGGNFIYQKRKQDPIKRFAAWGDGRVKQMYTSIADSVGFSFKYIENRRFSYAMKVAKSEIDKGFPVVLGPLDMYYLNYYPKIFHQQHIPIHYIMMVGYDDEKGCAYIQDCGAPGVCELSYEVLEQALDIEKSSLGTPNTVCLIRFQEQVPSVIELAKENFAKKARFQLNSPVGFLGIRGMRKLADEIDLWKEELSQEDYIASLRNTVMFTGTVPCLPGRLLGEKDDGKVLRMSAREKLAGIMEQLDEKHNIPQWLESAEHFWKSGKLMEKMTSEIMEYLLCIGEAEPPVLRQTILKITEQEELAYQKMLEGATK